MKSRISKAVSTAFPIFCAFASVYGQNSDLKPLVNKGCYSSAGGMTDLGSYTYQSPGYCQKQCVNQNKPVMGTTQGSNCYCGDLLPNSSGQVSSSQCSSPCNGYNQDMCGGPNAWSVQLTGLDDNVGSESNSESNSEPSASSTNSAPTSSPAAAQPTPSTTPKETPSVVTKASTIMVTAPGQTSAKETVVTTTNTPSSGGPNKAGIAAGVVIGVVAVGAIAGGTFLCIRNRKRRAIEDEYHRNFTGSYGPKPPSTAGSMSDSRLEPSVMFQRRQSDGSIADNQDYSRRILKVTNPDDS